MGAVIFIACKPIIKIYLIMAVGYALVKANIMTMETSRGISNMVVNVLSPCLVFNKVVTSLSGSQIKLIGITVLSAILLFGTGGVLGYIASRITPVPKKWVYGLIFVGIFGNISDLPIAYIQSMGTGIIFDADEANKGVAISCIFLAVQSFMMMNFGMFQMVGLDFREDDEEEAQTSEEPKDEEESIDHQDEELVPSPTKDYNYNVVPLVDSALDDGSTSDHSPIASFRERRRGSNTSSHHPLNRILTHESAYSSRSRAIQRQNTQTLIDEYSEAELLKNQTIERLARTMSKTQEIGLNFDDDEVLLEKHPKWNAFIKRYKLGWFEYVLINFKRVPSIGLLISLTCAMVPWIRALFVKNSIDIHQAPDHLPPLAFIMDFTIYIGNGAIPMGLILLGGTIARLQIQQIPPGFWKTSLFMVCSRLIILPIIGILWVNRLHSAGLVEDNISRFVLMITWAVPSATAQVYFTAFYTPLEGKHTQMECLAIMLLTQYPVLIITLAIFVSYQLKIILGY